MHGVRTDRECASEEKLEGFQRGHVYVLVAVYKIPNWFNAFHEHSLAELMMEFVRFAVVRGSAQVSGLRLP